MIFFVVLWTLWIISGYGEDLKVCSHWSHHENDLMDDGRSRWCCYVSRVFDSFCFFINDSRIQLKHRITDSLINLWFPDFWFDEKVLISHQGKVAVVVHQREVFRHQLLHLQQKFLFHYQIVRRPKEFLNMPLLANPLAMVHSKIREEM